MHLNSSFPVVTQITLLGEIKILLQKNACVCRFIDGNHTWSKYNQYEATLNITRDLIRASINIKADKTVAFVLRMEMVYYCTINTNKLGCWLIYYLLHVSFKPNRLLFVKESLFRIVIQYKLIQKKKKW